MGPETLRFGLGALDTAFVTGGVGKPALIVPADVLRAEGRIPDLIPITREGRATATLKNPLWNMS